MRHRGAQAIEVRNGFGGSRHGSCASSSQFASVSTRLQPGCRRRRGNRVQNLNNDPRGPSASAFSEFAVGFAGSVDRRGIALRPLCASQRGFRGACQLGNRARAPPASSRRPRFRSPQCRFHPSADCGGESLCLGLRKRLNVRSRRYERLQTRPGSLRINPRERESFSCVRSRQVC
jgi:hypothetical protein